MGLSKKGRYVSCVDCGSRQEMNGVCRICGHEDVPPLPGMVPNLIGITEEAAAIKLIDPECQLILGEVTTESSETVEAGLIISSNPAVGTQKKKNNRVKIVVSSGPAA